MLKPFELHKPNSVDEASRILSKLGEDAAAYGGGTELLLTTKGGFLHYRHLVDIKAIQGLGGVRYDTESESLVIGSTTTHREIELSPVVKQHLPILAEMERLVANVRVRNQGTIGGNLCFAEPQSDPATLFLALEAVVVAAKEGSDRVIPLRDFIVDAFTTALKEEEILTEIRIPVLPKRSGIAYKKFGMHERPTLGVAVALSLDEEGSVADARVSVGCVNPKPTRLAEAEGLLRGAVGKEFSARLGETAKAAAEAVDPVDDLHGSAEYKRHLVRVFVQKAAVAAREQIER